MSKMAISGGSPATIAVGKQIAEAGGNAIDVAVGAGLTATFSEVLMCSLGGSGFVMVKPKGGDPELIDGADAMPSLSREPDVREVHLTYGDGIEVRAGHGTVAVPGVLRALELAWQRHGTLPWSEILAPVIAMAKSPVPVGPTLAEWLSIAGEKVFYPQPASRECFFKEDGKILQSEDNFQIPFMAETMEMIAKDGADSFYKGDLAKAFADEMAEQGGLVDREDLAGYEAKVRKPIILNSAEYKLALNPIPAVGGIAVGSLLNLFDSNWVEGMTPAKQARLIADIQSCLLNIKKSETWHPPFNDQDAEMLIGADHLEKWWHKLAAPSTTHLAVAAADGAVVSMTLSNGYGSGINIPGTGIVCNNSLGEPELNPKGYYKEKTGDRLISNMAPTIGWRHCGTRVAFGSPGASRITTSIVQTWINFAYLKKSLKDAVYAPRLHVERWHDGLRAQAEPGIPLDELKDSYIPRPFDSLNMFFGAIKACSSSPNGEVEAVADPRRQGSTVII